MKKLLFGTVLIFSVLLAACGQCPNEPKHTTEVQTAVDEWQAIAPVLQKEMPSEVSFPRWSAETTEIHIINVGKNKDDEAALRAQAEKAAAILHHETSLVRGKLSFVFSSRAQGVTSIDEVTETHRFQIAAKDGGP